MTKRLRIQWRRLTFFSLTLFFIMLFLSSCKPTISKRIDKISTDNEITKVEFLDLQVAVLAESKYAAFKDSKKLYDYIEKYAKTKNVNVKIWNPFPKKVVPFAVNVYVENSLSMNGYTYQGDFKSSIFSALSSLEQFTKTINLNFINDRIIKASTNDPADFCQNLTKNRFSQIEGDKGNSDLAEVVKAVINKTDSKNASVLISDFIFSPPKEKSAVSYLNFQQGLIKAAIKSKLKLQNLAVAIYQMSAEFNGNYYSLDKPHGFNLVANRPYYIWFIGTEDQVAKAIKNNFVDTEDPHFINKAVFKINGSGDKPDYKVMTGIGKIGDFIPGSNQKIFKAAASNGKFGFSIAVNFANDIRGLAYFSNSNVYKLNDNDYTLAVRALTGIEKNRQDLVGYTHLLTLQTVKLHNQDLKITVLDVLPNWVATSSSNNDSNIKTDKAEQNKTFGLKYLIDGVYNAFSESQSSQNATVLTITIEK